MSAVTADEIEELYNHTADLLGAALAARSTSLMQGDPATLARLASQLSNLEEMMRSMRSMPPAPDDLPAVPHAPAREHAFMPSHLHRQQAQLQLQALREQQVLQRMQQRPHAPPYSNDFAPMAACAMQPLLSAPQPQQLPQLQPHMAWGAAGPAPFPAYAGGGGWSGHHMSATAYAPPPPAAEQQTWNGMHAPPQPQPWAAGEREARKGGAAAAAVTSLYGSLGGRYDPRFDSQLLGQSAHSQNEQDAEPVAFAFGSAASLPHSASASPLPTHALPAAGGQAGAGASALAARWPFQEQPRPSAAAWRVPVSQGQPGSPEAEQLRAQLRQVHALLREAQQPHSQAAALAWLGAQHRAHLQQQEQASAAAASAATAAAERTLAGSLRATMPYASAHDASAADDFAADEHTEADAAEAEAEAEARRTRLARGGGAGGFGGRAASSLAAVTERLAQIAGALRPETAPTNGRRHVSSSAWDPAYPRQQPAQPQVQPQQAARPQSAGAAFGSSGGGDDGARLAALQAQMDAVRQQREAICALTERLRQADTDSPEGQQAFEQARAFAAGLGLPIGGLARGDHAARCTDEAAAEDEQQPRQPQHADRQQAAADDDGGGGVLQRARAAIDDAQAASARQRADMADAARARADATARAEASARAQARSAAAAAEVAAEMAAQRAQAQGAVMADNAARTSAAAAAVPEPLAGLMASLMAARQQAACGAREGEPQTLDGDKAAALAAKLAELQAVNARVAELRRLLAATQAAALDEEGEGEEDELGVAQQPRAAAAGSARAAGCGGQLQGQDQDQQDDQEVDEDEDEEGGTQAQHVQSLLEQIAALRAATAQAAGHAAPGAGLGGYDGQCTAQEDNAEAVHAVGAQQAASAAAVARLAELREQNAAAQARVDAARSALAALHAQAQAHGATASRDALPADGHARLSPSAAGGSPYARPAAPTPQRMGGYQYDEDEDDDQDDDEEGGLGGGGAESLLLRLGLPQSAVESLSHGQRALLLAAMRAEQAQADGADAEREEAGEDEAAPLSPATLAARRPWAAAQLYSAAPAAPHAGAPPQQQQQQADDEEAGEESLDNLKEDIGRMLGQLADLRAAIAAQTQQAADAAVAGTDGGLRQAEDAADDDWEEQGEEDDESSEGDEADGTAAEGYAHEAEEEAGMPAGLMATGLSLAHRELDELLSAGSTEPSGPRRADGACLVAVLQLLRALLNCPSRAGRIATLGRLTRVANEMAAAGGPGGPLEGIDEGSSGSEEEGDEEAQAQTAGAATAGSLWQRSRVGFGDGTDGRPLTAGGGPRPAPGGTGGLEVRGVGLQLRPPTISISAAAANRQRGGAAYSPNPLRSPASTTSAYDYAEDVESDGSDSQQGDEQQQQQDGSQPGALGSGASGRARSLPPWLLPASSPAHVSLPEEEKEEANEDEGEEDGGLLSPETRRFRAAMPPDARPKTARGGAGADPFRYLRPTTEQQPPPQQQQQQAEEAAKSEDQGSEASSDSSLLAEMGADRQVLAHIDAALASIERTGAPAEPLQWEVVLEVAQLLTRMVEARYDGKEDRHIRHALCELTKAHSDLPAALMRRRLVQGVGALLHAELVHSTLLARLSQTYAYALHRLDLLETTARARAPGEGTAALLSSLAAKRAEIEGKWHSDSRRLQQERLERLYAQPSSATGDDDDEEGEDGRSNGCGADSLFGASMRAQAGESETADGTVREEEEDDDYSDDCEPDEDDDNEEGEDEEEDEQAGEGDDEDVWHVEEEPDEDDDDDELDDDGLDGGDEFAFDDIGVAGLHAANGSANGQRGGASSDGSDDFEPQLEAALQREMQQQADAARAQFSNAAPPSAGSAASFVPASSTASAMAAAIAAAGGTGGAFGGELGGGASLSARMAQYLAAGNGGFLDDSEDDEGDSSFGGAGLGGEDEEDISTNHRAALASLREAFRGLTEAHAAVLADAAVDRAASAPSSAQPSPARLFVRGVAGAGDGGAAPMRTPPSAPAAAASATRASLSAAGGSEEAVGVDDLPACLALDAQQLAALAARREAEARSPQPLPAGDGEAGIAPPPDGAGPSTPGSASAQQRRGPAVSPPSGLPPQLLHSFQESLKEVGRKYASPHSATDDDTAAAAGAAALLRGADATRQPASSHVSPATWHGQRASAEFEQPEGEDEEAGAQVGSAERSQPVTAEPRSARSTPPPAAAASAAALEPRGSPGGSAQQDGSPSKSAAAASASSPHSAPPAAAKAASPQGKAATPKTKTSSPACATSGTPGRSPLSRHTNMEALD